MGIRNQEIAKGILARTKEETSGITLTDSLPFQDRGLERNGKKYLLADIYAEEGVPLIRGNTARIHGWSQLRDRLIGISDGNGGSIPLIYFCYSCAYVREYIPALPYHDTNEEDAADSGEATHSCDCVRLACTARPLVKSEPKNTEKSAPPGTVAVAPIIKMTVTPSKKRRLS